MARIGPEGCLVMETFRDVIYHRNLLQCGVVGGLKSELKEVVKPDFVLKTAEEVIAYRDKLATRS